ncbi:MAG: hypothetical protein LUH06_04940 [Oscillospiraceae bacterium]|nr:hypothetical protein [Oscillospiraceae bacterium]
MFNRSARRKRSAGGFSLLEVTAAIVLLGLTSAPLCRALLLSWRLNVESEALLVSRLCVSSTVETLLAEGYAADSAAALTDVTVAEIEREDGVVCIMVSSGDVSVCTWVPAEEDA